MGIQSYLRSGGGPSSVLCTLQSLSLRLLTEVVERILLALTGEGRRREWEQTAVLLSVIRKGGGGSQRVWGRQTSVHSLV